MRQTRSSSELVDEVERLRKRIDQLERERGEQPEHPLSRSHPSAEHYKLLYEHTPSMSFALDPAGTVLSVNRFGAEQLGYTPEELMEKSVLLVFDPADHETVRSQLLLCAENPYRIFHWEIQKVHRNGRHFWVGETARAVRSDAGQLIILVMCEDISARKTAEALSRSVTNQLKALIRTSPLAIMALDPTGDHVTLWNHAAEAMFGWSEKEVLGKRAPFLPKDCLDQSNRLWDKLMEHGQLRGEELRRIKRDGTPISLSLWATVIRDEKGKVVSTFGLIEDITARKQAVEALRESEMRLRALYDQAPLGIAIIDSISGRFEKVNQKYCEITGYSKEDMLALTFQDVTYPDDLQKDLDNMAALLSGRIDSFRMEKRYIRQDSSIVWVNLTCVPLWLDASDRRLHIAMVEDITERKQTEKALQASEIRFRQIAETIEEVFWSADPAIGTMLYISPAYERVWGRSCASLHEHPKSFLDAIHPEDLQRVATGLSVQRDGRPFAHEYRVVRPDGTIRWVWDRGFPVQDRDTGRTTHYVGVALDITERKRAESALQLTRFSIERAADAIFWIDANARILDVNESACTMLGYTRMELLSMTLHDINPNYSAEIWSQRWAGLKERGSFSFETTHRRKDGKIFQTETTVNYVVHEGREYNCAFVRDISARKRAEAQLHLTQFAVDHAGDLIFWIDSQARFLYVNEAASKRLGYSQQELCGMTVADIDPNYQADVWPQHWNDLKQNGKLRFESLHRTKTGAVYPAEIVANFVQFGGEEYNFAFARDISERKAAEEALGCSEERFSKAFRSSPHPIVVTELESGRCIEVNDASLQLFGFSREEVIGRTTLSLGIWPTVDDRRQLYEQIAREGSVRNLDRTFYTKDHATRRCLVSCELIELDGVKCIVTVGTDITEQKRAEEALRQSEMAVRRAFDERERLSQDLHDNLLQSLYAVGMGLEVAKQRIRRISQTNAKRLETSVEQLNAVIREVREFIPSVRPPTANGGTAAQGLRSLSHSFSSMETKPIAQSIDEYAARQLTPEQSQHVLAIAKEALSNSLRHSNATKRRLSLTQLMGKIRLKVEDNGIGFVTTKRGIRGMGLKNMRARARKLGAHIAITSRPGKGTQVTLDIPLKGQRRKVLSPSL